MRGKKTIFAAALALAAGAAVVIPTAAHANADDAARQARGCAVAFDEAQSRDMNSFKDKDLAAQADGHAADAASVYTSGFTMVGRDAIVAQTKKLFDTTDFTWSWAEKARGVNGCASAYILYDTVFTIPARNLTIKAKTGVTYTHEDGRWLVIFDQNTPIG